MIEILILTFLLKIIKSADNVILVSSLSTVTLIHPSNLALIIQNYHTTNQLNFLGDGADWLWVTGSSWPSSYQITVQSSFTINCQSVTGQIYLTVDDQFILYLNSIQVGKGNNWRNAYNFTVNYRKGSNNLTVVGKNVVNNSPAGIIYKIVQTYDCNTKSNSTNNSTSNSTNNSTSDSNSNTILNSDSNDKALAIGISVPVLIASFSVITYLMLKQAPQPEITQIQVQQKKQQLVYDSLQNIENNQQIIKEG